MRRGGVWRQTEIELKYSIFHDYEHRSHCDTNITIIYEQIKSISSNNNNSYLYKF